MSSLEYTKNISIRELREFQRKLTSWSRSNLRTFPWRKKSYSKYQLVVAEVLLQRTKAETVAAFLPVFFKKYSSWKKLAVTTRKQLEKDLQPIGLSKQRAPRLLALAQIIAKHGGRLPREREQIDKLPAIGQYIANAIELVCFERPKPLLDVNMARVLERYFGPRKLADIRYDPYLQELARRVVDCKAPLVINWAILDFAALVCKSRNPLCEKCCLNKRCLFHKQDSYK